MFLKYLSLTSFLLYFKDPEIVTRYFETIFSLTASPVSPLCVYCIKHFFVFVFIANILRADGVHALMIVVGLYVLNVHVADILYKLDSALLLVIWESS